MFSTLQAYDKCFKIFHVFNVENPIVKWLFIQTFYYNIKTKYDKCNVMYLNKFHAS